MPIDKRRTGVHQRLAFACLVFGAVDVVSHVTCLLRTATGAPDLRICPEAWAIC